ncbi:MAG: cytochrome c [Candidatus Eremiobacteraeota bacterium]|nr:cytochrome c [Candidatus Eremiobacteraeota bacterium]
MRIFRAAAIVLILAAGACTTASYQRNAVTVGPGATSGGDRKSGSALFDSNCSTCHGPEGSGGGIGPSLRGESRRLNYDTLVSWIEDPEPPMPQLFPHPLSDAQVRDVAAYVSTL